MGSVTDAIQSYQEYTFPLPVMDSQLNPGYMPLTQYMEGQATTGCPLLSGIDARYQGRLRRFPGFKTDTNWAFGDACVFRYSNGSNMLDKTVKWSVGSSTGLELFKYFSIQEDAGSDGILRGWIVLGRILAMDLADSSTSPYDHAPTESGYDTIKTDDVLIARYYNTRTEEWRTDLILNLTQFTKPRVFCPETINSPGANQYNSGDSFFNVSSFPSMGRGDFDAEVGGGTVFTEQGGNTAVIGLNMGTSPDTKVSDGVVITSTTPASPERYEYGFTTSEFDDAGNGVDYAVIKPYLDHYWVDDIDVFTDARHLYVCGKRGYHGDSLTSYGEAPTSFFYQVRFDNDAYDLVGSDADSYESWGTDVVTSSSVRIELGVTGSDWKMLPVDIGSLVGCCVYFSGNPATENPVWGVVGDAGPIVHDSFYESSTEREMIIGWEFPIHYPTISSSYKIYVTKPHWVAAPYSPGSRVYQPESVSGTLTAHVGASFVTGGDLYPVLFPDGDLTGLTGTLPGLRPIINSVAGSSTGHYIVQNGSTYPQVSVAYRLVAPEQGWYGPLVGYNGYTYDTAVGPGSDGYQSYIHLGVSAGSPLNIVWPKIYQRMHTKKVIQFFRSVVDAPVSASEGTIPTGTLYLEREVELEEDESTGALGNHYAPTWGEKDVGLSDEALIFQTSVNVDESAILNELPACDAGIVKDLMMIVGTTPMDNFVSADASAIRWSSTVLDRLNSIPVGNKRPSDDLSSDLLAMVDAGPYIAVVYSNSILRVHRSSGVLSVDVIHNQHGAASKEGCLAVGSMLYVVTPVGILLVDLRNGQLQNTLISAHIFDERWKDSIGDVRLTYDAALGALIALNPTESEALLFWMSQGTISLQEWVPWDDAAYGPDPETGGTKRSWFIDNETLKIYTTNYDRSAETETTHGGVDDIDYNVILKANGAGSAGDVEIDSGITMQIAGTPSTAVKNAWLALEGVWGYNHTQGVKFGVVSPYEYGSTVKFSIEQESGTPAAGDMLSFGTIPMRVILPPISHQPEGSLQDVFRDKYVRSMSAAVQNSTVPDSLSHYMTYRLYMKDIDEDPVVTATGTFAENPASCWGKIDRKGQILIPEVAQYSSNLPFDLIGVIVDRTILPRQT